MEKLLSFSEQLILGNFCLRVVDERYRVVITLFQFDDPEKMKLAIIKAKEMGYHPLEQDNPLIRVRPDPMFN